MKAERREERTSTLQEVRDKDCSDCYGQKERQM